MGTATDTPLDDDLAVLDLASEVERLAAERDEWRDVAIRAVADCVKMEKAYAEARCGFSARWGDA